MLRPGLVVLFGFAVGLVPLLFGWPDAPAWIVFLLLVAGAVWAAAKWWRTRRHTVIAALLVLLPLAHGVWFFSLSRYDAPGGAPAVGQPAPDFSATRVRDGAAFSLAAQRGHITLLVFFRGAW